MNLKVYDDKKKSQAEVQKVLEFYILCNLTSHFSLFL